jgi:hypothetical protein
MPKIVTMALSHESEQPGTTDGGETSDMDPSTPGAGRDQEGVTPERLKQLIHRLETGFYDTDEVREQVARRAREDLDP